VTALRDTALRAGPDRWVLPGGPGGHHGRYVSSWVKPGAQGELFQIQELEKEPQIAAIIPCWVYHHGQPTLSQAAEAAQNRQNPRSYRVAVHNGVDYLCKTRPSLCAHWGKAGESIAGPPP